VGALPQKAAHGLLFRFSADATYRFAEARSRHRIAILGIRTV